MKDNNIINFPNDESDIDYQPVTNDFLELALQVSRNNEQIQELSKVVDRLIKVLAQMQRK